MHAESISVQSTSSNNEAPEMENVSSKKREITQKMGFFGAVSYIISNIVGSGIFIAPTPILENAKCPGLSIIVWVAGAIISILGSFCYIELGTRIRSSGADFAYLCYVKWYPVAFAFMCAGCVLNYPATIAIQAQTFSEYIIKGFKIQITSNTSSYFAKKLIGFSLVWLIMFLNFFSLKRFVSRFQIVASFAKILSTAIVIITGFYFLIFKGETGSLSHPFEGNSATVGSLVLALYAGLFSYDGWDILNFGAEEIEKPKKTMPLAILFGMLVVAVVYVATNISYFVVLSVDQIRNSDAVASEFAAKKLGNFQSAIPFLICVLLIGSLNSTIFAASRYLHAAAREGHLPLCISCVNQKSDSPRVALFCSVILSMGIAFIGSLDVLISYVSFTQWTQRLCTMCVLLWIRFKQIPTHPDSIRTPIVMPIVFFLICFTLSVITIVETVRVAGVGLGVLVAGFVLYFLFIYKRSLPSLKSFQKFSSCFNNSTTIFAQIVFNAMPDRCEQTDEREKMEKLQQTMRQQQRVVVTPEIKDDNVRNMFRRNNKISDGKI
uniref:Y+L amino acid transporter 2 n=1 Tax=Syphacia muris TaxID=451379 RepID=A0A158R562_9BILA